MMRILIFLFCIFFMAQGMAKEIAQVNGKSITTEMYNQLAASRKNRPYEQANAQERQVLTQILIEREVLYQEAVKQKLHRNPEFQQRLKNIEKAFYSEVLVGELLAKKKFSNRELKTIYTQVTQKPAYEYNVLHIMVRDQNKAASLIKRLQRGESFEQLAKKESTGKFRDRGGKLGWVSPKNLPLPLAQILPTMNKGKINSVPIGSQLGWHVVKLLGKRQAKVPPFDQVRNQVEKTAKKRFIQEYIMKKRKSANIKISTN